MPGFIVPWLAFAFWYLATLAFSLGLLWRVSLKSEMQDAGATFAALVIACHVAVLCCVPMVLTVVGVTAPVVYIGFSGFFLTVAAFLFRGHPGLTWPSRSDIRLHLVFFCGLLALVPALLGNIAPASETDSLDIASSVSKWAAGTAGIYDLPSGYPSFWELSYLPSFILTRSDSYFWVTSLEAVILFGVAAYLLARQFRLAPVLSLLAALNGVAVYHFWYGPSGVMTLKVDMVFAAGTILLSIACVRILRERYEFRTVLFLGFGCAFLLTKYTGVVLIGFALVLLGLLIVAAECRIPRAFLHGCGIALAAGIALPGHYYVRNLLVYRNPLYPLQLRILGITLPGRVGGFDGTSIFTHLGERQLWHTLLVPPRFVHYCGVLFPFIFLAFFLFASLILSGMAISLARRQVGNYELGFVAAFAVAGWILYGNAPWSAGAGPNDLFYLAGLASMRYISAVLFLSELLLAILLARFRWGTLAGSLLLALNFVSRIYILDFHVPPIGSVSILGMLTSPAGRFAWIGMSSAALLCTAVFLLRNRWFACLPAAAGCVGLLCAAPSIVDVNRAVWGQRWQPIIRQLAFAPSAKVFLVDSWQPLRVDPYVYLAEGVHAQHSVLSGSVPQLFGSLSTKSARPDFVLVTSLAPYPAGSLKQLERDMKRFDYVVAAATPYGALYRNAQPVSFGQLGKMAAVPAEFCSDLACISAPEKETGVLPAGTVYTATPSALWFRNGPVLRPLVGSDGDCIPLENIGFRHLDGSLSGLRACSKAGRWSVDYQGLDKPQDWYLVSAFHPEDLSAGGWSITGSVKPTTQVIAGPEGKYLRIVSDPSAHAEGWIALVYRIPETLDSHQGLALRAKLRCHAASVNAHFYDFGSKGLLATSTTKVPSCSDWSYVNLSHAFLESNERDYIAIGMFDLGPGASVDVASAQIIKGVLPDEAGNN